MYRTVACVLCGGPAALKPTKTNKLVQRCNACGMLLFGNGEEAMERLSRLPDYGYSESDYYYPGGY